MRFSNRYALRMSARKIGVVQISRSQSCDSVLMRRADPEWEFQFSEKSSGVELKQVLRDRRLDADALPFATLEDDPRHGSEQRL